MHSKRLFLILVVVVAPHFLSAQIQMPRISPDSELKQVIGLTHFDITYSRPGKRGRQIMGEIVPYERIWRVGANESTKFRVSEDILVNGEKLKSGTYALYAFPHKDEWEVVFHKDTTHWGDGRDQYDPNKDELRVKGEYKLRDEIVENFRIDFQDLTHNSGVMVWQWDNFEVSCLIEVATDEHVMADIAKQIKKNPTRDTYYQSARYLQEQGKNQVDALNYLDRAEIIGGPTYYIYRIRALVLAQLERYEEAIQAAEESKVLADLEGKDEFVRLNENSIEDWKLIIQNRLP